MGSHLPHARRPHRLHVGEVRSHVAGRTDHLPSQVPNGAYVLPADHVAHLGQDNTAAGFRVLRRMFSGAPYGGTSEPYGQSGGPYLVGRADGGAAPGGVPVVIAGGEYVVPPHHVRWIGEGDLDAGHRAFDGWVLHERQKHISTLQKLPKPRRD